MEKDLPSALHLWNNLPPPLNNDETISLIKEYKKYGDPKVRDKIVYGNLRFAAYYISKYYSGYVRQDGPVYPLIEDLQQEAALCCVKALEKFNLDYNFTFGTYLGRFIKVRMYHIIRNIKKHPTSKTVSLNAKVRGNNRHQDEEGGSLEDFIEDLTASPEVLHEIIEWKQIEKDILPLFTKRERDIFTDYFLHNKPQAELADKYETSQISISRILSKIVDGIKDAKENGISEGMRLSKGVEVNTTNLNRFIKAQGIIKKYGKNFLLNCFIPSLPKKKQPVFEAFITNFAQNQNDLAEMCNITAQTYERRLEESLKILETEGEKLLDEYKSSKKPRAMSLKVQQEINRTERLLNEYGGKLFLAKYFMPTLTEKEQAVFKLRFLQYMGQSKTDMAKKVGVTSANFEAFTYKIISKLKEADFEILIDLIDNAERHQKTIGNINSTILQKMKERKELVEKSGGAIKLQKYFLPILPEIQKQIFQYLYLMPRYESIKAMAIDLKTNDANLYNAEKIMLEKLKVTNIKELERISQQAEIELMFDKTEKQRTSRSNWKEQRKKFIAEYGGEAFLREVFMPTLEVKSNRIIFTRCVLEFKTIREVLDELKLPKKAKDYVHKTEHLLIAKLKNFKKNTPNFEEIVKDFYTRKEFEKLHPEDFEEAAFKTKDKEEPLVEEELTIKNYGREEDYKRRRKFVEEFLSQFGDKKELVRKFMPTLKTVSNQQVFLGSFLQFKTDEVLRKEYGFSSVELVTIKTSIVTALENYTKNKNKHDKKDRKR